MRTVQISNPELKKAAEKSCDDFLQLFIDKYLEVIGNKLDENTMSLLNGYQHTLLGYHYFREEILEGGFIQLIQNGYGGYIFDNPFAKAMRQFGAEAFSRLIYKAKEIYDKYREDLTRERSEDEFMAMYEQYEAFDELEEAFMEMEEEVTKTIAGYVRNHPTHFAETTEH